jgi:hypothetical protein
VEIIGGPKEPLPHLVDQLIKRIQEMIINWNELVRDPWHETRTRFL